jgi:uric acid transporter
MTDTTVEARPRPVHPVDQVLRPDRLGILGLQHVLIMYAGCVAVPLIVGDALHLGRDLIALLVNADLFTCGIATLIQSLGIWRLIGIRLPVVAGATFVSVTPMILIGSHYNLPTMYGAVIASGVFGLILARPFAAIVRFFPPLVTGTVITVIGLSLIGAAAGLIAGNDPAAHDYAQPGHLALAAGVVLAILLITRFTRGFLNQIAVLLGLVLGTLAGALLGLVDLSGMTHAAPVALITPLRFGTPQFNVTAVLSMCVVMLVTFTESTADMLAVSEIVDKPIGSADLARGLATDGLSAIIGGLFNAFPDTAFAQNVGLVGLTGVRSRYVVAAAGGILVVLGLLPPLGQLVAAIPGPVVGGAALVMFAMVTTVGIRTLHRVSFEGTNNLIVVATSLGIGMLPVVAPQIYRRFPTEFQVVFGSSITSTVIVVFLLNLFFNHLLGGQKVERAVDEAVDEGAVTPESPRG